MGAITDEGKGVFMQVRLPPLVWLPHPHYRSAQVVTLQPPIALAGFADVLGVVAKVLECAMMVIYPCPDV